MANQIAPKLTLTRPAVLAITTLVAVWTTPTSYAQTAEQAAPAGPKFDVASIKPVTPNAEHFMFGVRLMPGGGINAANVTLKLLIQNAYGIQDFQLSGGPAWIDTARFNIEAKPDSPAGPGEWKEMLKNLLADRFGLVLHRETRETSVYALVLARKDGKLSSGMIESKQGGCVARDSSKPLRPPSPGEPPVCGNVLMGMSQLTATASTVSDMVPMLSRVVRRMVIDQTGLTGKYDISLKFTPDENQLATMSPPGAPPAPVRADSSGPTLFTALQEQLGLKLEPRKAPAEIFVIDRAEKPSEN